MHSSQNTYLPLLLAQCECEVYPMGPIEEVWWPDFLLLKRKDVAHFIDNQSKSVRWSVQNFKDVHTFRIWLHNNVCRIYNTRWIALFASRHISSYILIKNQMNFRCISFSDAFSYISNNIFEWKLKFSRNVTANALPHSINMSTTKIAFMVTFTMSISTS